MDELKGLILCAGKGTRLRPFTFSQPKPLLPVANKPVLLYAIEQLINAGIHEIGIVINPFQKNAMAEKIHSVRSLPCLIHWIYQSNPKGVADAVRSAKQFIGQDPFLLLLGDNLIQEPLDNIKQQVLKQRQNGAIMLAKVENPSEYGIAQIEKEKVIRVIEKPSSPISNLAVIGAYAFDHHIFTAIQQISPSKRGEYEITDAIQWLIDHGYAISHTITDRHYSDVGTVPRWLKANQWKMDEITKGQSIIGPDTIMEQCTIHHPVLIGKGCKLIRATIGPYVSIEDHVTIDSCQIENSILLKGTHLKQISFKIKNSIFGRNVHVSNDFSSKPPGQFILGDSSSIYFKKHPREGEK